MNKPDVRKSATGDAADLLIELGCEELPPKSMPALGRALFDGFCSQLEKANLAFDAGNSCFYYTPRRLALLVSSVAARQPDQTMERKGPAVAAAFDDEGKATPAALGFARSVGKTVEELDSLKTEKGEWLYCKIEQPGRALHDLLFPMLDKALGDLPVAKPMRWGSNDFSFIRPAHWLVVMHGSRVCKGQVLGLEAGNTTRGHRIHSPGPHTLSEPGEYRQVLESACVIVDQQRRIDVIRDQVVSLGAADGGRALISDQLLEEVSNLVEWPRAVRGTFDTEFLSVPAEALIASMQDHQKFFPIVDDQTGALLNCFIAVANLESLDFDAVREGFERVIRPRLADARFFWDQDNQQTLEARLPLLDDIVFQKGLGSVGDKSRRVERISQKLADIAGRDSGQAARAGRLCKCDLVSLMVGEFPELQGIMGAYYAKQSGEDDAVADAIGQHYMPAYAGDRLPGSALGKIVSLADRLDTLTGIFACGLKPTGNKDPFALRRAAVGLIRILLDGELSIELDQLLAIGALAVQEQTPVSPEVLLEVRQFILERLKHHLREQGHETSLINASLDAPLTTLTDLESRMLALRDFMTLEASASLVAANKRIGNILRKSGADIGDTVNAALFAQDEERHLFEQVEGIETSLEALCERADYPAALALLAGLSDTIEAFFEQVMVMDDNADIRDNRLSLLAKLKSQFDRIANLARVG